MIPAFSQPKMLLPGLLHFLLFFLNMKPIAELENLYHI